MVKLRCMTVRFDEAVEATEEGKAAGPVTLQPL